jgi:hypothetical protein
VRRRSASEANRVADARPIGGVQTLDKIGEAALHGGLVIRIHNGLALLAPCLVAHDARYFKKKPIPKVSGSEGNGTDAALQPSAAATDLTIELLGECSVEFFNNFVLGGLSLLFLHITRFRLAVSNWSLGYGSFLCQSAVPTRRCDRDHD